MSVAMINKKHWRMGTLTSTPTYIDLDLSHDKLSATLMKTQSIEYGTCMEKVYFGIETTGICFFSLTLFCFFFWISHCTFMIFSKRKL